MLDYLCRSGVAVPTGTPHPGRGGRRRYTFGDVVVLRVLSHLLRCGISVAKLKRGLEALRQRHQEITAGRLPGRYLVTDGKTIYFSVHRNAVEELTAAGQLAFAFVVELKAVRNDVLKRIESKPETRAAHLRGKMAGRAI